MKSLQDISNEIGEWAAKNFKNVDVSDIGALEEVGEAAHCIIKRAQGIRGFDNQAFFIEQLTDALGDIGIYILHFCFVEGVEPLESYGLLEDGEYDEKKILGIMARSASWLLTTEDELLSNNNVNRLLAATAALGQFHGIDAEKALRDTWEKVCQRDWKENPVDGYKDESALKEIQDKTDSGPQLDHVPGKDSAMQTAIKEVKAEEYKLDAESKDGDQRSSTDIEEAEEQEAKLLS